MAERSEIEGIHPDRGAKGLCKMARLLGYRGAVDQLYNDDGTAVSDLLAFFDDNPGACEAVLQWVLDEGKDADGEELEEDADGDEDEEDEISLLSISVKSEGGEFKEMDFTVFLGEEELGLGSFSADGDIGGSGRWMADPDLSERVEELATEYARQHGYEGE